MRLISQGGAANFSGIELWKGHYDGLGAPIRDEDLAFFEKRIRPLLANKCYECHSAESKELQGSLLVDSRATLRRGGTKGPAVVAGDPDHSLLLEAVRYKNDDMQMPPDGKLSDAEIADLEHWVKIGAPDPRATATKHLGKQIDIAAAREFWSLKPISSPPIPAVKLADWPLNDKYRFILARQEVQNLTPTGNTEKRALIRRATYDLIGLSPTPEGVNAFLADESAEAFSQVVEQLLASPRYGERWGRHWLNRRSTQRGLQGLELGLADVLNNRHLQERANDSELSARIRSFETAFHMQTEAPEAFDVGQENAATLELYGLKRGESEGFGWQCLVARRLAERGVRFIELVDGSSSHNWDQHGKMAEHADHAKVIDQPLAGLLRDMKERGMLDDTLVIWTTEFGRTPGVDGNKGRGHHSACFSSWMAGAGVKGGTSYGSTDEIGATVAENGVHVHDFHATILHLLGIDHTS